MLVQLADLVHSEVNTEGKQEENESRNEVKEIWGDDIEPCVEVQNIVEEFQKIEWTSIYNHGKTRAPQWLGHIEFPSSMRFHLHDIPNNHLYRLEVLIRMEIATVGGNENHHYPHNNKNPIQVPNFPPKIYKI